MVPPSPPHTSNDHVICPICSRTFSRQSVLNVHTQMVHTNTKANMLLRPKPNFEVSQNVDDSVEDFLDGGSFFDDEWLLIFLYFGIAFKEFFKRAYAYVQSACTKHLVRIWQLLIILKMMKEKLVSVPSRKPLWMRFRTDWSEWE